MDCVYRKRKSYMHRVLKEIESIIHKNIAEVLPNLSFDELEDDGTVFLMNGKNGTEFEWYVNEKLPVFMAFYNDEANMGAAKATIYDDGGVLLYIYDEQGSHIAKEIKTYIDVTKEELLNLAVILRKNADDKLIWDKAIGSIETDEIPAEAEIAEFKSNERFYEEMIRRKALMGKLAVVSKRITEDGYRVGYMKREEPRDEEDSGWSFWAGNEDEEYSNAIENLGLYPVWHIADVDPTLMRYIDKPAGAALIRKSDDEFIDDNGEDPVLEKWKE